MRTRLALAAAVAALLAAPAAEAACGGVVRSYPREPLGNYRPPLILGDSAMIFPVPRLARIGFDANARGCRPFGEGHEIVRRRLRARSLPHLVVFALGSNGSVSDAQLARALRLVGPRRVLGLVTPREPGGAGSRDAARIRRFARRHPRRVRLADWARHSRGRPGWFSGDGLHLSFAGADAFTRLVRVELRRYAPPPGRRLRR